ncbi:sulfide dehydrogenase [flavocytochrome c] flavoprotein chain [Dinoroseobacter shibae DFL 12 = DSM 16493]|jgi:NADPH-dependent 2,4-dienoyl-CoA reductase/sulfur reductase-like enzyme|uniref:Sulfide dehydrogenase [flavocytochrome c] flavoprotein chain n=1 Tax=Dinoroseobacter shibae (strain DSM 16493 / NCIMB 14021 / DFL 12) TaxID=398580 RepID=A8LJ37_DINSH|nr:NAD(P)/FAD-dependent oxidoreductase [Dinoroseobacter shibae]ABV94532.1 sulfide dehydrogenase [flavocytochrome c] flavoprotein chain [Dinoroseobacter shibae DFL 12 = DSM 16493]URF45959.1 NAD(P)/FAD-dependent oxidoreductase [Dinoroseobacter shibae]URF50265.1 NAD(P)/FAD-dependent oxidoreductase [Dinoroseobacter shibae]
MTALSRRHFIATSAAVSASLAAPMVRGQGRPRVVVVGGGSGGATAARYIAKDSQGAIDVTLIEPQRTYFTCYFSNLYIGGFQDYDDLGHSYGKLASEYGINVVHDWAIGVDRDAKTVALAGGGSVPYDRLILSPGIDFKDGAIPGWDLAAQNAMPHAYKGGTQAQLLKAQIMAMPEGGTYAMVAPPNPYRCPPGPYERISMVAHALTQMNPTAKILIVDPKEKYSKQALFEEGWQKHYAGMVERIGPDFGGDKVEVRPDAMEVVVDGVVEKVDVCNVIPAQKAGRIAELADLTNEEGWAPVVPATMQSREDENIHVLGDASQQGDMPKSGYSANSQAKVAAMAVRGALTDSRVFPAKFSNTCWSLIATEDGVKVGASYEATEEKIAKTSGFISNTGEDAALRKATYEESLGWYAGITTDMFG